MRLFIVAVTWAALFVLAACQKCENCRLLAPREGQDTSVVKICGHELKEFKKMANNTGVPYECFPFNK
jgi:nitrous oxide reductase accessory protein NosL